jgi:hypothetical protein
MSAIETFELRRLAKEHLGLGSGERLDSELVTP